MGIGNIFDDRDLEIKTWWQLSIELLEPVDKSSIFFANNHNEAQVLDTTD